MPGAGRVELRIGIVGAGRLGSALALALDDAGRPPVAIAGRTAESARGLAARLSVPAAATTPEGVLEAVDLVFLTVPDGGIAPLAGSLPWRPDHAAVHCSGALALDVLAPAPAAGCLHPLQTFAPGAGAAAFRGIACGVEATAGLGPVLEELAALLGARPFSLAGADRGLYHAAAVFASNYVVAVSALAQRTWALAGLDAAAAREALGPLTLAAAANAARLPVAEALTGPVARGDAGTVARHLAALDVDPPAREAYLALARALLAAGVPAAAALREALADVLEPPAGRA